MTKEGETKNDFESKEIPETAIDYSIPVSSWLPHTKGCAVSCKLWQILPCNFRFFFGGKIMMGAGCPFWIYLVFILLAVNLSFLFYDVIPFYKSGQDAINGSIILFLTIVSLYNLLKVLSSDPGYMLPHWFSNQYTWVASGMSLEEIYNRYGYTSYCRICKIFQFPDTYHCQICHACIDGGDHHCHILGTCIGKRNYGSFYTFIVSANVALWLGFTISLTHFIENWISGGVVFALENALTFYLIMSTMIMPPLGLYVMVMLPFVHTMLIYQGVTLNQEDFRFVKAWYTSQFTMYQKFNHFLHNFYQRVIKKPRESLITYEVLQLDVNMAAVPRTEVVNQHHHTLQNQYPLPKLKLVSQSVLGVPMFFNFRMQLIHQDWELYRGHFKPVNFLMKMQQHNLEQASESVPYHPPSPDLLLDTGKEERPPTPSIDKLAFSFWKMLGRSKKVYVMGDNIIIKPKPQHQHPYRTLTIDPITKLTRKPATIEHFLFEDRVICYSDI